jgi:PAS domain S-box-containing protein
MVPAPDPFAAEAMRTGAVVVVRDLMHDRRFTAPTAASRAMLSGITAGIYQSDSLPPPAGERVGAFGVIIARSRKPRSFTRAQVQVVEDTAALLGRALVRRANERRLRESEEQFRQLAERSPDALFRTQLYPQPRLEYISSSVEAFSGYTAEELVNGDREAAWNVIHPDDRQKARDFLSDPNKLNFPLLLRWIHKSGSVVWTEQRVTPVLNKEGRWVAYQGVIRDVTGRILAEQRRQAEAEVTQLILEGRQAGEVLQAAAGHLLRLSGADYALLALPAIDQAGWRLRSITGETSLKSHDIVLPDDGRVIDRIVGQLRRLGVMGRVHLEPVRGSDSLLGVLGIANLAEGRRFSEVGLRAVGDFARQAALAIEYEQARADLQRLAVLEDRARISRELHDGVIQSLFGAGMILEGIGETTDVPPAARSGIARVAQMIDNTMVDVRSYIFDLRPSALAGRNIEQGLRALAEDFEKASSIPCSVEVEPEALAGLEDLAPSLIQIAREALSNVARHARASACQVRLYRDGNEVILEIHDNGRGFKPGRANRGSGLKNIRGRAAEIGARVQFISAPRPSASPSARGKAGGSTVRIHLRVTLPSRAKASSATTTTIAAPRGGKVKV